VRAKYFIQKIRENANKKDKYNKLTDDIIKAKDDLDSLKKEQLMDKIYKIYAYKKLKGLVNALDKCNNRARNIYGNQLMNKLLSLNSSLSFNYNKKQELKDQAKITKLNFKNKIEKKDKHITEPNVPMRAILPELIKYIENLIKKRKRDTFEKVKNEMIRKNFKKLLNNFNNKLIEPKKKEFLKKIIRESKYSQTRPIYQSKLFQLFRKKFIRTIRTSLIQPSRLYRLFYLVNMTKMHENIAAQRYYREIIRKWRFISFTKKMARKKLELMYKNMHASYLQMADEIFGDDKINPSVFKEFERFGSNVGMFTGHEPEIDEELNKKYYTNIDKKYKFTKRASGIITEVEDLKKDEFAEGMYEGSEEKVGDIKRSSTQTLKINDKFNSIKNKGLSSKGFFSKK
jgi:hypothetical protein